VHAPSVNLTVRDLMAEEGKANHRDVYGKDLLLLIGDWYHQPASQVLDWYMRAGSFGNEVSRPNRSGFRANCNTAGPRLAINQRRGPFQLLHGRTCTTGGLRRALYRFVISGF
jgi:hypothetical protein